MSVFHSLWTKSFAITLVLAVSGAVHAAEHKAANSSDSDCGVDYVEKTICVPQWVTETRVVSCTEYRWEPREYKCTVYRNVYETRDVTEQCTVLVPKQRTRTVNYTVCVPYTKNVVQTSVVCIPEWRDVEYQYTVRVPVWTTSVKEYTVNIPYTVKKQGVRKVCRVVPVQTTRTVRRCVGHWETHTREVPDCGGCGVRSVCCRVWVPKWITEEVPCTTYKTEYVDVPYTYCVTLCKQETRTCEVRHCSYRTEQRTGTRRVCSVRREKRERTVQVCAYRHEQRSRDIVENYCVPEARTYTRQISVCRPVAEVVTRTRSVCVPHTVKKEVQVRVCKTVTKVIRVPVCSSCGGCGGRHRHCR